MLPPPETVIVEVPVGSGVMTTAVAPFTKSVSLVVTSEKNVMLPEESVRARFLPSVEGKRVVPVSFQ